MRWFTRRRNSANPEFFGNPGPPVPDRSLSLRPLDSQLEIVAQRLAHLSPRAIKELIALPPERNRAALDPAQLDDWVINGGPEWAASFTEIRSLGRDLHRQGGHYRMVLVHDRVVVIDRTSARVAPGRYIEHFWDQIGEWQS